MNFQQYITTILFVVIVIASDNASAQTGNKGIPGQFLPIISTDNVAEKLKPAVLDKLDVYFKRYCNYTGSLGIGFVPAHTYDYKFRQRLKETEDNELKRLFVLQRFYREFEIALGDFEQGVVRIGKGQERKMTPDEREAARLKLLETLRDLSAFDPDDPEKAIETYKAKLR